MSAALPPLPDLIPISVLRKGGKAPEVDDSFNNNCSSSSSSTSSVSIGTTTCSSSSTSCSSRDVQDCSPCNSTQCSGGGEVMGEQRSRRTGKQPAVDELIDTSRSRGNDVAAPQQRASSSTSAATAAATRKARSERHRKSDRRRERERRKRSTSSLKSCSSLPSSPERPANPRVNPIFVWVRQQDSQIVEVKCEDYDKRNRILLTKTPQGWRAIPRTETLAPTLQRTDDTNTSNSSSTVDRAKRKTKKRSNCKVKKNETKSTGVQVDDHDLESEGASSPWNSQDPDPEPELDSEIEIIEVFGAVKSPDVVEPCANGSSSSRSCSSRSSVSVSVSDSSAQVTNTQSTSDCNNKADVVVSPLDNLLAVAELEFNQQIQSEQWEVKPPPYKEEEEEEEDEEEDEDEQIDNMQQLDIFIESCAPVQTPESEMKSKPDDCECDYTEEDDNNLAMDDILSRLEQSLRSPDTLHSEINEIIKNQKPNPPPVTPPPLPPQEQHNNNNNNSSSSNNNNNNGGSSSKPSEQETPTDLSTTTKDKYEELNDLMPTDLTLPKSPHKRPQSQNSETIQSPQPSGIPAIPHSPDLYSANKSSKSNIYLESLLSPLKESPPPPKEPLDLGKTRESDSPKVTCSQEVQNPEPPTKKIKLEDITLKTLLDNESNKSENHKKSENKNAQETPRLLELLTEESEAMADPVMQLKQLLKNTSLNIPDPMLIPKDKLSQILSSPAQEIPKLLTERPELRLPEALAFPHLLQDPDILVITLSQLQTIIQKQSQSLPLADKTTEEIKKKPESPKPPPQKPQIPQQQQQPQLVAQPPTAKEDPKTTTSGAPKAKSSRISELSSDIDAATNAAFTQMMWLPYLNQLESAAMTFGNNPEFLKLLSTMLPSFPGPMPDMTRMMGPNRLPTFQPPSFPMQPPMNYNPLELSMWQEAMLQANLAHTKNQFDLFNKKDYKAKNNNMFGNKNPFMNVPPSNSSQFAGSRSNLQMSPYNTHPTVKHGKSSNKHSSSNGANKNMDYVKSIFHQQQQQHQQMQQQQQQQQKLYESEKHLRQMDSRQKEMLKQQETAFKQHQELQKQQELFNKQHEFYKHQQELYAQKPKVVCKSFANMSANQDVAASASVSGSKRYHSSSSRLPGPIDLSGSTTGGPVSGGSGKLKVKQHLIDPVGSSRLLKHDDVPEVGSTTASIEEMQDAQKHLWHPLFGNQKSYTSPWNWTTVTATGE